MNRSQRVKRGFKRLALVGFVPSVLLATGGVVYQIKWPTGAVFTKSEFTQSISSKLKIVNYEDRPRIEKLVLGPASKEIELRDGRTIRVYSKRGIDPKLASDINDAIVQEELSSGAAISGFDYHIVLSVAFACTRYKSCDAPFPKAKHSHLSRYFDWSFSAIALVIGMIWSGLLFLFSWLIRGFMAE